MNEHTQASASQPDSLESKAQNNHSDQPSAQSNNDGQLAPLVNRGVPPAFAEGIRMLAQNVEHAAAEQGLKVLLVMGTYPGDGRTTIAANLGIALAHNKHRVVLVDADNLNPSLHEVLGLEMRNGNVEPESIPRRNNGGVSLAKVNDKFLYVLAPDDAERFAEQKADEVLDALRTSFDFIVVDTAPCLGNADVFRLATLADAVIYAIRRRNQDLQALRSIRRQLTLLGANLLGAVYTKA